jgi:hypothetical protein
VGVFSCEKMVCLVWVGLDGIDEGGSSRMAAT